MRRVDEEGEQREGGVLLLRPTAHSLSGSFVLLQQLRIRLGRRRHATGFLQAGSVHGGDIKTLHAQQVAHAVGESGGSAGAHGAQRGRSSKNPLAPGHVVERMRGVVEGRSRRGDGDGGQRQRGRRHVMHRRAGGQRGNTVRRHRIRRVAQGC